VKTTRSRLKKLKDLLAEYEAKKREILPSL
jgi:hypothetical protein